MLEVRVVEMGWDSSGLRDALAPVLFEPENGGRGGRGGWGNSMPNSRN